MSAPAIDVRGVSLGYDGGARVLEALSVSVPAGEFVCVVGPSGCGKSTLLNVIAGFLPPQEGEVWAGGERVRGPDPRRLVIFQDGGLFPWLTVEQNVRMGLLRRPEAERAAIVQARLAQVGLSGQEDRFPAQLSGGMRQRVELARALAADPDILYMDEPFGALDFLTRLKMRQDLVEIWAQSHKTVLFVTHDVDESVQLADRVLVLSGRPARLAKDVRVDLPRPRDLSAPAYLAVRDEILLAMGFDPHHAGASGA
jgi:NitT/TauT family transport system ATP-binding protein